MSDLRPGDVVEVKSGGEKMTVDKVLPEHGTAYCVWLDKEGHRQERTFSISTLKKVEGA